MSININLNNIATTEQLATILTQELPSQANATFAGAGSSFGGAIEKSGHNCAIMSTIKGMALGTSGQFADSIGAVTKDVENAIAAITENVGAALKDMKSALDAVMVKVNTFAGWVSGQLDDALNTMRPAIESMINGINNAFNYVQDAISGVLSAAGEIMDEMIRLVKNTVIRACESLSGAVENVGSGSGIDKYIPAATIKPNGEFAEQNLAGMKNLLGSKSGQLNSLASFTSPAAHITDSFKPLDGLMRIGHA